MFDPKRYIFAGSTVIVALAIGMIMQQENAPLAPRQLGTPKVSAEVAALDLSDVTYTSGVADLGLRATDAVLDLVADVTAAPQELAALAPDDRPQALPFGNDCAVDMTGSTLPAARIAMTITAPCHGAQPVTLHHNGMMISVTTDDAGKAEAILPALSPVAVFIAAFEDGAGGVVTVEVPETARFDRVVLQWRGDAGFALHALENGAGYGDAGHVSAAVPHDPARAESGQGGYLETLGDTSHPEGLRAEVYTFPRSIGSPAEVVLNAEIEVTAANCGKPVEGQAIQMAAGSALRVQELALTVPSCEVTGDILLLKNLMEDLKIADN